MDKAQFKLFLRFLKYLIPYKKKQIVVFILSGMSVLLSLVNPYLSKIMVDRVIIGKELRVFIALGAIGALIFILNGFTRAMISFLERGIRLKLHFDLNKKVFSQLHRLPLDFFYKRSTGEYMFTIHYDAERVVDFISAAPAQFVNIFPRLFFIIAIIFYLNWQMALFSLILAPVLYLPIYYLTHHMRRVFEELINNSQNIFKRLNEVFSHIYLVKAFGMERIETRNYLRSLIANIRINLKNIRLEIINDFVGGGVERTAIGLVTLFGIFQIIKGKMGAGTFTAIMVYLSQLVGLQNSIAFFFQRTAFGLVSCKRLDEVFKRAPKTTKIHTAKKVVFREPKIEFREVSFGYNSQGYVIKDANFRMSNGAIAFVGHSGCGKTTILNLILRLHNPWKGSIYIEGYDIRDLELSLLREQIGVALQDPFLWNDTIEDNIRYADPNVNESEILAASKIACVDEFVNELPFGYKTIIGENACRLSEGQKQRISIARALIKKPKILILDEAMSSIDSLTEEKIIARIKGLPYIYTVIIVTHRLSTVMGCDSVYFIKKPESIIIGRPQELLDKDNEFYDLFSAQNIERPTTIHHI